MRVVECGQCGSVKRAEATQCPNCELGIFKQQLYWIPMAAIIGLLLFSFSRAEHADERSEVQDRQAIDHCRNAAATEPHTSQDPLAPCAPLIDAFMLKHGHQPD
jgi:hypothetical protein